MCRSCLALCIHLTVAPDEPVPDRRKMMREPSVNTKRRPCFDATLPSTGSAMDQKEFCDLKKKGKYCINIEYLQLLFVSKY